MQQETQFILQGAEFAYANTAEKILRGIDLEIRAGEWVALLGSNGSGKSTLLKILSALLTPTQGFCFVCGLDTREAKPEQLRGISSIVFQNPEDQIVAAVVEEEAAFGPENLGCPTEEICRRVEESLKATGLWERRGDLVSSLSGGQKQRLALAGALAMHPQAILLDEALSMLDPRSRLEFTEIIKREHAKGVTIVEVTHRLEEIRCAGRVIVMIVACIAFFNSLGTDGSFGNEDTDKAVLSQVGKTIVPLFEPMGVQEENWPAAVGIFTGVLAKEAVVGTLNSLYDTISVNETKKAAEAAPAEEAAAAEEAPAEEGWSFGAVFSEAVGTIGENFAGLASAFTDPLGITVGDLSEEEAAAEEQGVSTSTIDTIKVLFGSSTAAFAYLLMVLLYLPCCAAIAAIYREVGTAWTLFAAAWTSVLGYSAATIYYRVATFVENPMYSIVAIACCAAALVGMYFWMRSFAKRDAGKGPKVIPIYAAK